MILFVMLFISEVLMNTFEKAIVPTLVTVLTATSVASWAVVIYTIKSLLR